MKMGITVSIVAKQTFNQATLMLSQTPAPTAMVLKYLLRFHPQLTFLVWKQLNCKASEEKKYMPEVCKPHWKKFGLILVQCAAGRS